MPTLKMKPLSPQAFLPYGRYASMSDPCGPALGGAPIRFFRDLLPLGSADNLAASVTLVEPMPMVVDVLEYHSHAWEAFMMLDADACVCVGPATADQRAPLDALEAFHVPAGTMIYLHPGVWHYAPYPLGERALHSLVLLPERTYANDCVKVSVAPAEQPTIAAAL